LETKKNCGKLSYGHRRARRFGYCGRMNNYRSVVFLLIACLSCPFLEEVMPNFWYKFLLRWNHRATSDFRVESGAGHVKEMIRNGGGLSLGSQRWIGDVGALR
jgi:hypothetical protein